jgi:hypothetical protein
MGNPEPGTGAPPEGTGALSRYRGADGWFGPAADDIPATLDIPAAGDIPPWPQARHVQVGGGALPGDDQRLQFRHNPCPGSDHPGSRAARGSDDAPRQYARRRVPLWYR